MDQKLQRGTAASRPLVFRQAADATIPGPHPHCEGKNDRCLTTISSEPATSKKAPSVRSSTSYYTACVRHYRSRTPSAMVALAASPAITSGGEELPIGRHVRASKNRGTGCRPEASIAASWETLISNGASPERLPAPIEVPCRHRVATAVQGEPVNCPHARIMSPRSPARAGARRHTEPFQAFPASPAASLRRK